MTRQAKEDSKTKDPVLLIEVLYLVAKIAGILLCVFLVMTFVFGVTRAEDVSMLPNVSGGDIIFYNRHASYTAGDVVVINYDESTQVQRVIAIGGDTVDITEKGLFINGSLQQEANIIGDSLLYEGGTTFPVTLKPDELFVMGDNRSQSIDSRMYGPVKDNSIAGSAMLIIRTNNI